MTVIVLDANIFCQSPKLQNQNWTSLLENRQRWGVKIVVPEVVFMETVNVVRRTWDTERGRVASLKVGVFGLSDQQHAWLTEITRHSNEYEQWLHDRLGELEIPIVKTPQMDPLELARRSMQSRAPYRKRTDGKKPAEALRDTLIWLTAVAVAEEHTGEKVWFLSNNHEDFGPEPTGKQGANPNEACPFPLHPDLVSELADKGLSGRLEYVVKMDRLIRHLESLFEPIPDADLIRLTSDFDRNVIADLLVSSLVGLEVDPQRAALPLQTLAATVVSAEKPAEGWRFSDGAGRGEAGWTARFCVTAEIDLALLRRELSSTEATKQLQVSGDVMVAPDGEIQSVVVTSVDALPDDPMRARWKRRAEREATLDPFAQYAAAFVESGAIADAIEKAGILGRDRSAIADAIEKAGILGRDRSAIADAIEKAGILGRDRSAIADAIQKSRRATRAEPAEDDGSEPAGGDDAGD